MKRATIEFDMDVPDDADYSHIKNYFEFWLNVYSSVQKSPMSDMELEAIEGSVHVRAVRPIVSATQTSK